MGTTKKSTTKKDTTKKTEAVKKTVSKKTTPKKSTTKKTETKAVPKKTATKKTEAKVTPKKTTAKSASEKAEVKVASKKTVAKSTTKKTEAKATPKKTTAKSASENAEVKVAPKKTTAKPASENAEVKVSPKKTTAKPASEKAEVKVAPKKTTAKPASEKAEVKVAPKKTTAKPASEKTEAKKSTTNKTFVCSEKEAIRILDENGKATDKKSLELFTKVCDKYAKEAKGNLLPLSVSNFEKYIKENDSLVKIEDAVKIVASADNKVKVVKLDPIDEVRELPDRYNETRLVIMVRDPNWCFAYWDISDNDAKHHKITERNLHLKVYRLLAPENLEHKFQHLDIQVGSSYGSWYIMLGMPNNYYIGEIGYYDENDNFITLARSSIVYAPRDTYSDIYDEEWLIPEGLKELFYGDFEPESLSSASLLNLFKVHVFGGNLAAMGGASSSSLGGASSSDLPKKDR